MLIGNLIRTYFEVKAFNIKQQAFVIRTYYKNLRFCFIDLLISFIYLFFNPYRTSKNFLKKKNSANIHVYGETPLATFEKIINECHVSSDHFFLELGAGRGRCAFWLSEFIGCKIDAVEWIPLFHNISLIVSKVFRSKNLTFIKHNMFDIDLHDPDIIFLYGTCLDDQEICSLIEKFKKMHDKVKIITISYALSEYDLSFSTLNNFPVLFPWGKTTCYINQKKTF